MKQATASQYFFAQNWPMKICLAGGPVISIGSVIKICWPVTFMLSDWRALLPFLISLLIAPILGFFLAVLFFTFFVAPICRLRAHLNGAPFQKGDIVQILAGPHKGRLVTVYSGWQGEAVRVRLGDQEEKTFKDIFSTTALLRESDSA